MRSGGRWAALALLLAGAVFAWPTYVRYFALHPGPVAVALLVALVMYLPSLWAIRYLDRHAPEPSQLFWGSVVFVVLFAPITSRVMHALIDSGLVSYWVIVGPLEELTKLLPLLLIAVFGMRGGLTMRDGIVYGALGGLGFAVIEFAANFSTGGYPASGWPGLLTSIPGRWALGTESHIVWGATAGAGVGYVLARRGQGWSVPVCLAILAIVMATHGVNDLYGKYIGPLAMVLLIEPARAAGIDLANVHDGSLTGAALLVYSAVTNTLVMNLLVWPILAWGVRHSRVAESNAPRLVTPA